MDTFPELLSAARSRRGIQLQALAELTGIQIATLSRYESGERRPTMPHVVILANVLGEDGNAWLTVCGYPVPLRRSRKSAARMMAPAATMMM